MRVKNDSPFQAALFVSTLHHVDTFTDEQKLGILRAALAHALDLAHAARLRRLATTVLKGGWRLGVEQAYATMMPVYDASAFRRRGGRLLVCCRETAEYEALLAVHRARQGGGDGKE